MSADLSARLPDELLYTLLDDLSVEDLVRVAMPVCRRWRTTAIDHPTYWRRIRFRPAYEDSDNHTSKLAELLLLRVARTYGRNFCLELNMSRADLDAAPAATFLPVIPVHLARFTELDIHVYHGFAQHFLDALQDPAPNLRYFRFSVHLWESDWTTHVSPSDSHTLSSGLFSGQAPLLETVRLDAVALADSVPLSCFQSVRRLTIRHLSPHGTTVRAADIFGTFPQIKHLTLKGKMVLDHADSDQTRAWSQLDRLDIVGRLDWDFSNAGLPTATAGIPHLYIDGANEFDVATFSRELPPGALELVIACNDAHLSISKPQLRERITLAHIYVGPFTAHLMSAGPTPSVVRSTAYDVPWSEEDPDRAPRPRDLLSCASITARLTTVHIPLPVLARLAAWFAPLPALTHLALLLDEQPAADPERLFAPPADVDLWSLTSAAFSLTCPALTALVLCVTDERRRLRHSADHLRAFLATALPESAGPLTLRLVRVELEGEEEALRPVVSEVLYA